MKNNNAKKIGEIMKSIQRMESLFRQINTEMLLGRYVLVNLEKAKTDIDKELYIGKVLDKKQTKSLLKLFEI